MFNSLRLGFNDSIKLELLLGGAKAVQIIGNSPFLQSTWYPALRTSGSSRASVSVIGDSITAGYYSTNWDTKSYVALLRSKLQTKFGNGGEGFLSMLHTDYAPGAPGGDAVARWSYDGVAWVGEYADAMTGAGAAAGRKYCNTAVAASLTFTGDSVQLMTAHNHLNGSTTMDIYMDNVLNTTWDCRGDGVTVNLQYGQVVNITGLGLGSHTIKMKIRTADGNFVFAEGVRPLIGTAGVVVDRFSKGWMRADWLGNVNDGNSAGAYYQSLKSSVDVLDTDLYIVALGIDDYINQTALATFETRMTTIVQRCKAKANCVVLAMPQPNSSLAIPYSSYVTSMQTVATAQSAMLLDVRARWGNVYNADKMTGSDHPNDVGHADIAQYVYDSII